MTETRPQTIWRHAHELINRQTISWPTLATTVRAVYVELVPTAARKVEWSDNRDTFKRAELDAQTLKRFEHDVKFGLPSELEEAMVIAMQRLDYRHQDELIRELAERYGLLAAPIPHGELVDDAEGVKRLMTEVGEAIAAVMEIAPDGITKEDEAKAKHCLIQINEAMAEMVSMQARVTKILPEPAVVRAVS